MNLKGFVGVAGFEPTTSTSQMWRDTGLRYTPMVVSPLLAVRAGFEPAVPLPVRQFSKLFLSASQAPHLLHTFSAFRGCKYSNSLMFAKKNYVVCG